MKKLILIYSLIISSCVFANFDLEGFRADLTKSLEIGRVLFSCGEEAQGIVDIYAEGNRIAELHGIEGVLPDGNDLCASAISEAIKNGVSLREISEAAIKQNN